MPDKKRVQLFFSEDDKFVAYRISFGSEDQSPNYNEWFKKYKNTVDSFQKKLGKYDSLQDQTKLDNDGGFANAIYSANTWPQFIATWGKNLPVLFQLFIHKKSRQLSGNTAAAYLMKAVEADLVEKMGSQKAKLYLAVIKADTTDITWISVVSKKFLKR
jgi:hypothetical protein